VSPWLRRLGLAPLALAASLSLACAQLPHPRWPTIWGAAPAQADQPGSPPEYDFLVARQFELDGQIDEALAAYQRALAKDPDSPFLHRATAELLARNGRVEDALPYAERAQQLEPDDEDLRLFLGTLYRIRKDSASAERMLRKDDGTPLGPDAALLLYGLYSDTDRLDTAMDVAKWMVRTDPKNLRSHFALARVYERMERPADAERALRAGLKHNPGSLAVYAGLARGRRQRGDRAGEVEIYREVLRRRPNHHATLVALGDALIDMQRLDEARRTLEIVEKKHPDDLRSIVRLGYLDLEQKRFPAAEARFKRVLVSNPEQAEVHYFLGTARRQANNLDGAIEEYERVPVDHERYLDARLQLAAIYERRHDYTRALGEAEAVRQRFPSRQIDLYVASLRAKTGDFDGAVAFLQTLLAASPGDEEVLYNLGVLHGEANRQDDAMRYMEQVLAKNPEHAGALNYVGYSLAERGQDLDKAEQMVRAALQQRPDDGYIVDSLGWVYYVRARQLLQAGQTTAGHAALDHSVKELERAAVLTGGDPVISEHLGDAHLLRSDRKRALRHYEEAASREPRQGEQPHLLEKVERLRKELGSK